MEKYDPRVLLSGPRGLALACADERTSWIPLVFLSAETTLACGSNGFVRKPSASALLARTIDMGAGAMQSAA